METLVYKPRSSALPVAAATPARYTSPSMAIARDNSPERLVSASRAEEEQGFELKLRPRWLREFIGQSKAKEQYTKSLLNYSHRIPFNPKPENLTALIDECLFLLNPLFHSKRIRITKNYEHDMPDRKSTRL